MLNRIINKILLIGSIWFIGLQSANAMIDFGSLFSTDPYPTVTSVQTTCPFAQCLVISGSNLNLAQQVHFADTWGGHAYDLNLSSPQYQVISRTDTEIRMIVPAEIQIPELATTLVQAVDSRGTGAGVTSSMPISEQLRGRTAADMYRFMVGQLRNLVGGMIVQYYIDRNGQFRMYMNSETGDGAMAINESIGLAFTAVASGALMEGKVESARLAICYRSC